jgi:hypothetical protein
MNLMFNSTNCLHAIIVWYSSNNRCFNIFLGQENICDRDKDPFWQLYNSNSKISMSSVPDRKFNSLLNRIPVETVFDVLGFLTYEQWFVLQFSNWRLAKIIKKNMNYLAYPKFFSIAFHVRVKYLLAFNSKP